MFEVHAQVSLYNCNDLKMSNDCEQFIMVFGRSPSFILEQLQLTGRATEQVMGTHVDIIFRLGLRWSCGSPKAQKPFPVRWFDVIWRTGAPM